MKEIKEIIKSSYNKHQILKKLGWDTKTYGYRKLNKYISENNIDISHLDSRKQTYERNKDKILKFTKIPLSKILVSGSSYQNTSLLKKRLYKEGLKLPICEMCGQNEWWYDKKISLILDHINGIHNDHRIENLRILCPNCNATLPTHCGRNSKRNKKKNKLTTEMKLKNKKEQSIKSRKMKRPPYDQLLKEIKEMGYSATGRKYGVSDNAIRKWIKFYKKYDNQSN
jgi:iron-sulfur cluster repair protein YtfE (RIC family)